VKINQVGDVKWNKTYGGTNYDEVNDLLQTSDGGYVLVGDTESNYKGNSYNDSDIWVIKTDSTGNALLSLEPFLNDNLSFLDRSLVLIAIGVVTLGGGIGIFFGLKLGNRTKKNKEKNLEIQDLTEFF
jgi:hypothetical protein